MSTPFPKQTHTLFISDLHLDEEPVKLLENFEIFLREKAPAAKALYILGDLFEAWIGDDDASGFNQKVCKALAAVAQGGTTVFIMRGNRDFLIGKKFLVQSNTILLEDPTVIDLYGRRVLLTHGDLFCQLDRLHQIYRKITVSSLFQKIFLLLPLKWRKGMAGWLRQKSQQHQRRCSPAQMEVLSTVVDRWMREQNVDFIIHGHTHRAKIHDLVLDGIERKRIVLGAWHDGVSVFTYYDDHRFILERHPLL